MDIPLGEIMCSDIQWQEASMAHELGEFLGI